jgi:hypothetical protein
MTTEADKATRDPFAAIDKKAWLANLREGLKWNFYIEQFRLATARQSIQ